MRACGRKMNGKKAKRWMRACAWCRTMGMVRVRRRQMVCPASLSVRMRQRQEAAENVWWWWCPGRRQASCLKPACHRSRKWWGLRWIRLRRMQDDLVGLVSGARTGSARGARLPVLAARPSAISAARPILLCRRRGGRRWVRGVLPTVSGNHVGQTARRRIVHRPIPLPRVSPFWSRNVAPGTGRARARGERSARAGKEGGGVSRRRKKRQAFRLCLVPHPRVAVVAPCRRMLCPPCGHRCWRAFA